MENRVNELIEELRRRINNLNSYSEDSYLLGVANIAEWLFNLKEFKPALEELDKKKIYQMKILEEAGNKLFEEIKKVWEVLKKYIDKDVLLKLDNTQFVSAKERERADFYLINKNNDKSSEFKPLRLEQMIEGEGKYYVLDIYHELRLLIEQLYNSPRRNEILKNNLVIFNNNGQIKEFVSENIFQLFLSFRDAEKEIEKENELSPIEAYNYLRQLLVLKKEEDWRWQLKEWRTVFGKDFYTPRLHILSDFLYDFFFRKDIKDIKIKFFWWEGSTFQIQLSSGSIGGINFYGNQFFNKYNNGGLNTYYLMYALTDCLRRKGERNDGWLEVLVDKKFIVDFVKKFYNQDVNDWWIKNTMANLRKKIPLDLKEKIKIEYFDRKRKGYPFRLKLS